MITPPILCPFCKERHRDYYLTYEAGGVIDRDLMKYIPNMWYKTILEVRCERCGEAWVPPRNGELMEHEYTHMLEWRRKYNDGAMEKRPAHNSGTRYATSSCTKTKG